ncbi:hypothetical protein [Corynebacterium heidelbergense]|uniref:DUF2231 domain-containing protein n=1 Tax=Corynebacterium heidelbergense TaxID=2055947 RepID=A0A364V599_9CORY|nr:hypothetical protein [Corynebacterium heidelbergense]RAV31788.1 hypothetical protein DLJ54_06615 [Corynebacterium heidelbergense]
MFDFIFGVPAHPLYVHLAVVALVGTQLAKSSGEAATHAMLGEYSVYSALALFIDLTATVLLAARSSTPAALALVARVGTVGIAIASVVLVVWAGHAGAHLTWERMPNLAG